MVTGEAVWKLVMELPTGQVTTVVGYQHCLGVPKVLSVISWTPSTICPVRSPPPWKLSEWVAVGHSLPVRRCERSSRLPTFLRVKVAVSAARVSSSLNLSAVAAIEAEAQGTLDACGWKTDYVMVRRQRDLLPATECLKDVVARMLPYWYDAIVPDLAAHGCVLVVAHGNSLRALVKHLDGVSAEEIVELNIPTGIPRVYDLDADLRVVGARYLGDPEQVAAKAAAVAAQGTAGTGR